MPLNTEAFARCVNLSPQACYILEHGLAPYADLAQHLTLEDALNLIEHHRVSQHNKALMEELLNEFSNSR